MNFTSKLVTFITNFMKKANISNKKIWLIVDFFKYMLFFLYTFVAFKIYGYLGIFLGYIILYSLYYYFMVIQNRNLLKF